MHVASFLCGRGSLGRRVQVRSVLAMVAVTLGLAANRGAFASEADAGRSNVAVLTLGQQASSLGNGAISASWKITDGHLADLVFTNHAGGPPLRVVAPFALVLADGKTITPAEMALVGTPGKRDWVADATASRLAEHFAGQEATASFRDTDGRFRIDWQLQQRDGSAYLREQVTITALKQDESIAQVQLLNTDGADDATVYGDVQGSPVVVGNYYFGFENPLSDSEVHGARVKLYIKRSLPLHQGQSIAYSAVVGVAREGQLRRDFATYIERERAHPYRPFLHYNSWYDIGYLTPYTQQQALDRIHAFGEELSVKRGVKLDSFLFDDGWDDLSGSWNFNKGFPQGFVPLKEAAAKYGAAPGIWLSPWGGYAKPKQERVKNGRAAGYEIIHDGFALSGPRYYQRFHAVVMNLLNQDGINQFKFDGTGNVDSVFPGSRFDSDFAAAIELIKDIRVDKPTTFINLTTGTWASPFWLRYADSIWRGGEDDYLAGVGTNRERWITYRDAQTYHNIVQKGPLFPLNSLMLHGIIYAQMNKRLNTDPGHDFPNEVHSYFATGTQLQEMYITPSLLSQQDWDTLAGAAKWSRANADVLRDTHWIGGDPGRLDVYGWAAWSPQKAIVTFRNPDDKPRLAEVDLQRQLELPQGVARHFHVHDVWKTGGSDVPQQLDADHVSAIKLAPFEVLTLELTPEAVQ
jgi:hypothetical protein